jgi:hypothetical protein
MDELKSPGKYLGWSRDSFGYIRFGVKVSGMSCRTGGGGG